VRRLLLLSLVGLVAGCSGTDNPIAPGPAAASVVTVGSVSTTGCFLASNGDAKCAVFSGVVQNAGAGCANNVHGVFLTYIAPGTGPIGSAAWSHAGMVRPSEQLAFSGGPVTVGFPLVGGWSYFNNIAWDSVAC
jgi:hypothetical protein